MVAWKALSPAALAARVRFPPSIIQSGEFLPLRTEELGKETRQLMIATV